MAEQTTQTVTTSKQFWLNYKDLLKGLLVATITAPITVIYTSVQAGTFTLDWKAIGLLALSGFLSYIVKNFLTPAQTVITGGIQPTAGTVAVPADTVVKEVKK